MRINRQHSEIIVNSFTSSEVEAWLKIIEATYGELNWIPVGGKMNNVHTVEVSTDPGLALAERPTNSIDAVLDLAYLLKGGNASSPAKAAEEWYGVPDGSISKMGDKESRILSEKVAIRMFDSGDSDRPTVQIQDQGTGQHPDEWGRTLLSLQESNKKSSMHLMGVYNSGGAASFKFSEYTVIFLDVILNYWMERKMKLGLYS